MESKALVQAHVPKTDIQTRHKVIRFGALRHADFEQEKKLYDYLHQRADLKVSRGSIPCVFFSVINLDEGHPLYMETRFGGYEMDDTPIGPQYQVTWRVEKEIIPPMDSVGDGWYKSLDELWSNVLSFFERKNLLTEETLDYLDADPFVLFGIDDPVTQQALIKLERFPALMCKAATPDFDEWSYYIRIDPTDAFLTWLVRAMMETELPRPWTCYKGVGSIVCYVRSDSGQVTWKHPYYDYFRQLRDFCRQATKEEVMQVRSNRLLWSYEATRVETEHDQEPLVSPDYVARMADIFGYDVKEQGCVVRNCKSQLKAFAKTYRTKQDIDLSLVATCKEMLDRDVEKYAEMVLHWSGDLKEEVKFELNKLASGETVCVNCHTTALCFCLECKDYLCLACYSLLHMKGARKEHAPFRLSPCALCVVLPAKIHCTFTDKSLCHKCYAMKHIKMLPTDGKENQPRRIDYVEQYNRYAAFAKERAGRKVPIIGDMPQLDDSAYESVLSTDWHPFYDARGVKYYHNFSTGERMRQSPRRVPNTDDAGGEVSTPTAQDLGNSLEQTQMGFDEGGGTGFGMSEDGGRDPGSPFGGSMGFTGGSAFNMTGKNLSATVESMRASSGPMQLTGFDSLKSQIPAAVAAAARPDNRTLRAPHRVHAPKEVAQS